jgi:hypothetical protein
MSNQADSQINTQEILKKDFLNIFEISYLFDVSGITARRHIKGIMDKMAEIENKMKLDTQEGTALLAQELNVLAGKARKRVVGQTKSGQTIYLLELANKEAFANWQLRPAIKGVVQEPQNAPVPKMPAQNMPAQKTVDTIQSVSAAVQAPESKPAEPAPLQDLPTQNVPTQNLSNQWMAFDGFGEKYIKLLESQLSEKDDTIKDLRETNKFLSITNGKLNEQLRFLLEKPQNKEE